MAGGRVGDAEYAGRVNAAAELAEAGVPVAEAATVLAARFAVSVRQARRYVDQAVAEGRVEVPEASVVFTVKLPAALARRGGAPPRETETPLSPPWGRARPTMLSRGAADGPPPCERRWR